MAESSPRASDKTLGVLLGVGPSEVSFRYGIQLAATAQRSQIQVYLYLLDDAINGMEDSELNALIAAGAKVMACAYGARKRNLPLNDSITFGGLGLLNNLITKTDRFVGFCH